LSRHINDKYFAPLKLSSKITNQDLTTIPPVPTVGKPLVDNDIRCYILLIPIRIDDQQSFDLEKSGQYAPPVAAQPYPAQPAPVQPYPEQPAPDPPPQPVVSPFPAPAPEPVAPPSPPADCKPIGVDPDTHMTICAE
jgi:cell division protein FtsN